MTPAAAGALAALGELVKEAAALIDAITSGAKIDTDALLAKAAATGDASAAHNAAIDALEAAKFPAPAPPSSSGDGG